jgi:hypothetical protein
MTGSFGGPRAALAVLFLVRGSAGWRVARAIACAVAAALCVVMSTEAHETNVHQALTSAAIEYLIQQRPEMAACGLPEVRRALGEAVWDEDDFYGDSWVLGRFLFHFLPVLNDEVTDASLISANIKSECDSKGWADGSPCSSRIGATASGSLFARSTGPVWNEHDIFTVRDRLEALPPQKDLGLRGLGHLLHLLQDLTSPPHTQNDAHPPSPYYPFLVRPGFVADPSAYEVVNQQRPDLVGIFKRRTDAANRVTHIPWPPDGGLITFQDPLALMQQLRDEVSRRFPSEKNVNTHPAVVGRVQPPSLYVFDDATHKRIAVVEWGTGEFAIDRAAALEQFEALAPLAVKYSASLIQHYQDKNAPVCEQQLKVGMNGAGQVISTSDDVRPAPEDQIACGTPGLQRCEHYFPSGKWVELTATGNGFEGWLDAHGRPYTDCPGTGPCRVRMKGAEPETVIADYGGDPVSGLYQLTAVNGSALPAPWDFSSQASSGEYRFLDRAPWSDPSFGRFGSLQGEIRLLVPANGASASTTDVREYLIGEVSADAVPVPFTFSNVTLPPGRILHHDGRPLATVAGNRLTLYLRPRFPLEPDRLLTLEKQPAVRSASFDPVSRTLSFPDTLQGSTSPSRTVTITNTGIEPLAIDGALDGASAVNFSVSRVTHPACDVDPVLMPTSTLPPGESCDVELRFTPNLTYRTGPRTGTVTWRTNAGSTSGHVFRTVGVALEGSATGEPQLSVAPTSLTFPATAAGSVSNETVVVQNTGDVPLVLSSPSVLSPNFGVDAAGCRSRSLPPGASCSMVVKYGPFAQSFTGTLTIPTNSGSTAGSQLTNFNVPLAATNGQPVANAGPDQFNLQLESTTFVNGSASIDLEGQPLTYLWQLVSTPPGSAVALTDTASSFASFKPDIAGVYVLQLVVSDGLLNSDPDIVVLSVDPPPGRLTLSSLSLTFPETPVGTRSATQRVTVTNTGGSPVSVGSRTVNGDFAILDTTCFFVEVQQTCTIDVYFLPLVNGPRSGELIIASNAENSPSRVFLGGNVNIDAANAPVVTSLGHVAFMGVWNLTFYSGDDDEEIYVKIGDEPEFEFDMNDPPGHVLRIDFGIGTGTVRLSDNNDGESLMPISVEALPDGRYLLHLHDNDPPNEIEVTLVAQRVL